MIITFSGPDGIGKSDQLMRLSRAFQVQGIDHNIMHVRGLETPLTKLYRKMIRKWNKGEPKGWILTAGLILTTLEMIYFWAVKLRLMEKRHQVILCDRYIWDTEVDFTARFPDWKPQSPLWLLLKKVAAKPDASILYHASTDVFAQRLYRKKEYPLVHEIQFQQNLNKTMIPEYHFVIDANTSKDAVFHQMLTLLRDGGMIPKPSDRLVKNLRAAIIPILPGGDNIEIVHLPVGRSLAVNYCISVHSVPRYFAKICKPSKRCLKLMKPLTKTSPYFNRIEEVIPIGIRNSCILQEWKVGSALIFSAGEACQAAQAVKKLHSVMIPLGSPKVHIGLELFRHLLYVALYAVSIPHKKEILGFLVKNLSMCRKKYALTHMDLHGGNFRRNSQNMVYLIDYENIRITDPWRDFTYAVFFHEAQEDVFWYEFLRSYFNNSIPSDFWKTMRYYCYLQALRMMVCSHQRKDQRHIDNLAESIWKNYHNNTQIIPAWYLRMDLGSSNYDMV